MDRSLYDALIQKILAIEARLRRLILAFSELSGDVIRPPGGGPGSTTIVDNSVTNLKLADMPQATLKGRAVGAGTGDPQDLTGTQATAILVPFVGDSGSGGVKGLVPAPSAGDAAAGAVLFADGTWAVPGTGGSPGTGSPGGSPSVTPTLATFGISLDGAGVAITTGIKGDVVIPVDCEILDATLLADQTGSIVIDLWVDSYANFPPTDADSITASAPPTISSGLKSFDSTLTGWTTSLVAGDIVRFNVDSCSAIQRAQLQLTVTT